MTAAIAKSKEAPSPLLHAGKDLGAARASVFFCSILPLLGPASQGPLLAWRCQLSLLMSDTSLSPHGPVAMVESHASPLQCFLKEMVE